MFQRRNVFAEVSDRVRGCCVYVERTEYILCCYLLGAVWCLRLSLDYSWEQAWFWGIENSRGFCLYGGNSQVLGRGSASMVGEQETAGLHSLRQNFKAVYSLLQNDTHSTSTSPPLKAKSPSP